MNPTNCRNDINAEQDRGIASPISLRTALHHMIGAEQSALMAPAGPDRQRQPPHATGHGQVGRRQSDRLPGARQAADAAESRGAIGYLKDFKPGASPNEALAALPGLRQPYSMLDMGSSEYAASPGRVSLGCRRKGVARG